jgi:hypothetical protein
MDAFGSTDRLILRRLAARVREIAAGPVMDQRRALWREHNALRTDYPPVFVYPYDCWVELIPPSALQCEGEVARDIELDLRARIYQFEHFDDDMVVEAEWVQLAAIGNTGWGITGNKHASTEWRGAWGFEPVLRSRADAKKLRFPQLIYDERASLENVARVQDLFGDILEVKPAGIKHLSYHLMAQLTLWLGFNEMMLALVEQPEFVHEIMRFLVEGHQRYLQQLIDANLLSLNNDNTYNSSGGNGYTAELPAPGFDARRVRPCDMWAAAESQEFAQISPRMHAEFAMQYEKQLLEPFGLTGYGCCEDLSRKLDDVLAIPHIRRISISPWANVDICAPKLKGDYIFSWKPNPAHLVGGFDAEAIRGYIRHTLDVARANGCVLEIVLKDTQTVDFDLDRFDRWVHICRTLIRECYGDYPPVA